MPGSKDPVREPTVLPGSRPKITTACIRRPSPLLKPIPVSPTFQKHTTLSSAKACSNPTTKSTLPNIFHISLHSPSDKTPDPTS
ncbi:hypothetical protein AAHC03_019348 [Spirometra sp. Aus1]